MTALGRIERAARRGRRAEQAARSPGRYVKNRAVSKGLGVLGLWRLLRSLYR